MIRPLLPVAFVLGLAVIAGILLAQNAAFSGSDPKPAGVSTAAAGEGCCGKIHAEETGVVAAAPDSGCCSAKAACREAQCPSMAFASLAEQNNTAADNSVDACQQGSSPSGSGCCSGAEGQVAPEESQETPPSPSNRASADTE